MADTYDGIVQYGEIKQADIVNALNKKVSLTQSETIAGTKTFSVSPGVPAKQSDSEFPSKSVRPSELATTVIATEAQVADWVKHFACW